MMRGLGLEWVKKSYGYPVRCRSEPDISSMLYGSGGRVEDGRGSLGPLASAPFPIPAHRTGDRKAAENTGADRARTRAAEEAGRTRPGAGIIDQAKTARWRVRRIGGAGACAVEGDRCTRGGLSLAAPGQPCNDQCCTGLSSTPEKALLSSRYPLSRWQMCAPLPPWRVLPRRYHRRIAPESAGGRRPSLGSSSRRRISRYYPGDG